MTYHGVPYFVSKSTRVQKYPHSFFNTQPAIPDQQGGIRYSPTPKSKRPALKPSTCNRICPPQARGARGSVKLKAVDIKIQNILITLILIAAIAISSVSMTLVLSRTIISGNPLASPAIEAPQNSVRS